MLISTNMRFFRNFSLLCCIIRFERKKRRGGRPRKRAPPSPPTPSSSSCLKLCNALYVQRFVYQYVSKITCHQIPFQQPHHQLEFGTQQPYQYRKHGIGGALVHAALVEAKKQHHDQVMVILMPKGMARGLFTKMGFEAACEFSFYIYGVSAEELEK